MLLLITILWAISRITLLYLATPHIYFIWATVVPRCSDYYIPVRLLVILLIVRWLRWFVDVYLICGSGYDSVTLFGPLLISTVICCSTVPVPRPFAGDLPFLPLIIRGGVVDLLLRCCPHADFGILLPFTLPTFILLPVGTTLTRYSCLLPRYYRCLFSLTLRSAIAFTDFTGLRLRFTFPVRSAYIRLHLPPSFYVGTLFVYHICYVYLHLFTTYGYDHSLALFVTTDLLPPRWCTTPRCC